ncbi:MAG: threonine/serine dehydratase [Nitrososphaerales archaeon]|nr:threonine/serine dehydratase [Nitrososphaerales archaeon]
MSGADALPDLEEIERAEERIRRFIPPTPLEYSARLSSMLGREVYLKLEAFQPIHVFKIRGALNKLIQLGDSAMKKGVVTASSGNHGLAIAYASRMFGTRAVICVPENANPQKVSAIEDQGAEVVRFGKGYDQAYEHALRIAERRKLTFVHAFNDRDVIAGQGTCGLEMVRQLGDLDSAVVAIGGGGLISGISIALKRSLKSVRVYGAETTAIPSMYASIEEGRMVRVNPKPTIADGMQSSIPGELTFKAVSKFVDKIGLVNDRQLEDAIYDLLVNTGVLAEPAGASPLAALKGPLRKEKGSKTVLVVSGGNISVALLAKILKRRVKGTP